MHGLALLWQSLDTISLRLHSCFTTTIGTVLHSRYLARPFLTLGPPVMSMAYWPMTLG
jgi:hypothetical protein